MLNQRNQPGVPAIHIFVHKTFQYCSVKQRLSVPSHKHSVCPGLSGKKGNVLAYRAKEFRVEIACFRHGWTQELIGVFGNIAFCFLDGLPFVRVSFSGLLLYSLWEARQQFHPNISIDSPTVKTHYHNSGQMPFPEPVTRPRRTSFRTFLFHLTSLPPLLCTPGPWSFLKPPARPSPRATASHTLHSMSPWLTAPSLPSAYTQDFPDHLLTLCSFSLLFLFRDYYYLMSCYIFMWQMFESFVFLHGDHNGCPR